jgi:tetratricopeptide (TPR) repeat protein
VCNCYCDSMNNRSVGLEKVEDEAVSLMENGKLRRAEQLLLRLLESDRNSLPAHFNLARLYRRTKQYDRAIKHARRTLRLNPKEPHAHLNLAMIYDEMGCNSKAARHYLKELRNNPTSPETICYLGNIYFENRQWRKASKLLRRCLDLGFTWNIETIVHQLGVSYYHTRDIQAFIGLYTWYLEIDPRAGWAAANLGGALLHAGDYKRAVLWLAKAHRLTGKPEVFQKLEKARRCLRESRSKNQKQTAPD